MTDALERIKNRQRPEVAKRDPGMTSMAPQAIAPTGASNPDIEKAKYSDIQISTLPEEILFSVKQTTLRLEKGLSDDLQALCQREQICREVLIEAMFLEMLNAPEFREGVVDQARERQRKRTAVANHKRAVSMMQRVSS